MSNIGYIGTPEESCDYTPCTCAATGCHKPIRGPVATRTTEIGTYNYHLECAPRDGGGATGEPRRMAIWPTS